MKMHGMIRSQVSDLRSLVSDPWSPISDL